MRPGDHHNKRPYDAGVTEMIDYVITTTILMILLVIVMLLVNANFMEGPLNTLTYSEFTDIGNGVSTRIVEIYAIAPTTGNISSTYDIPDDIVGQGYSVDLGSASGGSSTQEIRISRGTTVANIAIAGISSTAQGTATGNTTGAGINTISYNSGGV
jgi:hypothetical protein